MPQRKFQNKLPEVGECLEKLQTLEPNVTEEDFLVIGAIKESLELIKGKWKTLNTNYKNLFQEKSDYEHEIERSSEIISKMKEEKEKYLEEFKNMEAKTLIELMEKKELIESLEHGRKELLEELDIIRDTIQKMNIENLLEKEKRSVLENELISLRDLVSEKEKIIGNMRIEKEALDHILLDLNVKNDEWVTKSNELRNELESKNNELISKFNHFTDVELNNKMLNEQIQKLSTEKDNRIKLFEARISSLEHEIDSISDGFMDQIRILKDQKKNMESLLNDLTVKYEKKFKCCIM